MKNHILLSLLFFSGIVFGYTEEDFNAAVSNVSQQIYQVQTVGTHMQQAIQQAYLSLDALYSEALELEQLWNNDYYHGYSTGVGNAVGTAKTHLQTINYDAENLQNHAAQAQQALANLRYISGNTNQVDMTGVITAINNASTAIQSLLNTGNGYLQNIDYHISRNLPGILDGVNVCYSALSSIVDTLNDIKFDLENGSGSGGTGSNEDLVELIGIVTDFYSAFLSYSSDVLDLVDWMNDANGVFKKFYTDATDRMAQPDAMLATDLARMWQYTFQNFTNIVQHPERYLPSAQVDSVLSIDGDNFRLSNEGLIAAHNLAMNQRQYLCSLAMLEELKGMNATNNLAWITNYLNTVQKPYYMMFDQFSSNLKFGQTFPFKNSTYRAITNFFAVASDPTATTYEKTQAHTALASDSSSPYRTNYWARLEMYLQGLNGFFVSGDGGLGELTENLDEESIEHKIEDATNNLFNVVGEYGSMSNHLVAVLGAFKEFTESFSFDIGEVTSGQFTICPSIELGVIQIPDFQVDFNDLVFFVTPCRRIFQLIWYTVFSVLGFKFVLLLFRLVTKAITHTFLIISTLIS